MGILKMKRGRESVEMGVGRACKGAGNGVSIKWVSLFCIASFFLGVLIVNRLWVIPDLVKKDDESTALQKHQQASVHPVANCEKNKGSNHEGDFYSQVSQTHDVIMTLDKTISSLEMQLAAARAAKADTEDGLFVHTELGPEKMRDRLKFFFVMGIITAFGSRKRRDSIRNT